MTLNSLIAEAAQTDDFYQKLHPFHQSHKPQRPVATLVIVPSHPLHYEHDPHESRFPTHPEAAEATLDTLKLLSSQLTSDDLMKEAPGEASYVSSNWISGHRLTLWTFKVNF